MRASLRLLSNWETVIGLELHIQIKSPQKLFSTSKTSWSDAPNTHASLFDLGYPGTLPTLSRHPVKQGLLTALALNCNVPATSQFDRKHYFYHDQPLGYQITQHYHPLALAGQLVLPTTPPKTVRIQQIQLEQDTAKTSTSLTGETLIDFNRAGIGLMEVVTEADITSAEEAALFVRTLRGILRRIGASDADMDKGSLRVDCNISINRPNTPRGTRTEIKNLNSLKNLSIAVASEVRRQSALIDAGEKVVQETRGFDESIMDTVSSRSKEGEKDYRYMPDGNLPILRIDPTYLAHLRSTLPELPLAALARLSVTYPTLSQDTPSLLVGLDPGGLSAVTYFESVVAVEEGGASASELNPRLVGNWVSQELVAALGKEGLGWVDGKEKVTVEEMREVVRLVESGGVTDVSAKTLLSHLIRSPIASSRVQDLLAKHSLTPLASKEIDVLCAAVIADANAKNVGRRKPDKLNVQRLIGDVKRRSGGRADARVVGARLEEMIKAQAEGT